MKGLSRELTGEINHWWLFPILGVVFILLGAFVIMQPLRGYIALVLYFVCTFFVSGVLRLTFAFTNRQKVKNWGWYVAGGVLDLVFGALLFYNLPLVAIILPYYVGFFLMFSSFAAISESIDLKSSAFAGWGQLLSIGILGLICSVLLLMNPTLGIGTIIVWTALGFMMMGAFYVYLGFRFHKAHHFLGDVTHA